MNDRLTLPKDWCLPANGVDLDGSGIYEWRIEGAGSYIGKFGRIRRPTKEYRRNVIRLLNGRPYRKGNEHGFRWIHHELAWAVYEQRCIQLVIVEIVDVDQINERERALIRERGNLNGTLPEHRTYGPHAR